MFECWGVVLSPPVLWTSDVCYFELHLFPPSSFAAYQRRDSLNTWHILLIKKLEKGTQPHTFRTLRLRVTFWWFAFFGHLGQSHPMFELFGKGPATKSDEFSEKFHTALDPHPSFSENYVAIFYDRYGCIYARRYDGQIVWNACTWFPEIMCILGSMFSF